jgi:hypothetical protein
VKLFMNDYVPAHVKIPQKSTQWRLLRWLYYCWLSVIGILLLVSSVVGCWSLVVGLRSGLP